MTRARRLLAGALAIATAGCASGPGMDRETNRLAGSAWRLVAIDPPGPALTIVPNPELYVLEFRDETAVRVRADCNGCDGAYVSAGRALTISAECPTMPCAPGSVSREFLGLLNRTGTFALAGGGKDLFVNTDGERTTLSLRRID